MHAAASAKLSIDEFYKLYEGEDARYELDDGVPVMMAGGSQKHSRVAGNLYFVLRSKLSGAACEPFGSDMGVKTGERSVRYPDVSICCDPRDLAADALATREHRHPKVVFEVLSPSTTAIDRGLKLFEYKALASIDAIVFVDAERERFDLVERLGPDEWRLASHLPGAALSLRDPALTISAAEMFGRN